MIGALYTLLLAGTVSQPDVVVSAAQSSADDQHYLPRQVDYSAQNEQIIFDTISSLLAFGVLEQ